MEAIADISYLAELTLDIFLNKDYITEMSRVKFTDGLTAYDLWRSCAINHLFI